MTKRLLSPSNVRTAVLLAGVAVLAVVVRLEPLGQPDDDRPAALGLRQVDRRDLHADLVDARSVIFIAGRGARSSTRAGASATGRARPSRSRSTATPLLEISWTIAFAVVLLIIGIPTIRIIFKTQEAPAATALRVDVAGKQWWWEFTYPEFKITTANELHIPVGQTVAFHLHAPDVIHSFWMPAARRQARRRPPPGQPDRVDPRGPGRVSRPVRRVLRRCRMPICASA